MASLACLTAGPAMSPLVGGAPIDATMAVRMEKKR